MKRYRRPHRRPEKQNAEPGKWFCPPARDFYRLPDLVLRSGYVATDGCRRVLDFTPEKICLDLGDTIATLYGNGLKIESFSGRRLIGSGLVRNIEFRQKWEAEP
ncbi:YabP/YqfC family sporulation protein [uncultured Gemmiger sp.]|uniref:YabP/YqfC family sporulation protein n=1 Tax=uncultured Gemmiger sp. TaxID=1623490 RepID=UPI0025FF8806|nr:YabP/YqfC family sporulation protein [uncultured Gemmiger sp.]